MTTTTTYEILDWPTGLNTWWWMRLRQTRRSKWRVMLVKLTEHSGTEYIRPFQDSNCYPRSLVKNWQAAFVEAEPPPSDWLELIGEP